MGRPDDAHAQAPAHASAHDRLWRRDLRDTFRCAGALLVLLLVVDHLTGHFTLWRGAL
ncbi:hypothetical protein [Streptomyces sp. NPDC059272]